MISDAFLQVRPQQQRIALAQDAAHTTQKVFSSFAIEIANCASQKQHQQMIPIDASIGHCPQTFQIRLFVPYYAHQIDLPQLLLARRQRRRRNLDGEIIGLLPPRKRFQNPARLFSASAAQFGDLHRRRQPPDDLPCMFFQQARVCARQPVLRQDANRLEQC